MHTLFIAIAACLGGFLGLLFGGGPHREDPPGVHIKGWCTRGIVMLFMLLLATVCAWPEHGANVMSGLGAFCSALVLCIMWTPGHGSYLSPGAMKPDNEPYKWIVKVLTLGLAPEGSVLYCCVGMSVKYGGATGLASLVMTLFNSTGAAWLPDRWGCVGLFSGLVMYAVYKLGWNKQYAFHGFWNPTYNNGPWEFFNGALIFGALYALA